MQLNVMIAMVLSGLWHGETLNFLIWGAIHGVGVVFLNIKDELKAKRLAKSGMNDADIKAFFKQDSSGWKCYFNRFLTFNYVCIGWIFFRSVTFDDSTSYITALFTNFTLDAFPYHMLGVLLAIGFTVIFIYPYFVKLPDKFVALTKRIPWFLLPALFILILWGAIFLAPSGIPQFIYASF